MKLSRLKLSKKRLFLIIGSLLIIAGISLFKVLSGPSEGAISYPSRSTQSAEELNKSFVRYDGRNISFSYPEAYRFEARQDKSASIVESYFLVAPAKGRNPSFTIGVSVYRLPGADLAEDSSYKLRINNPQTYKKSVATVGGREVIYFKNQSPPEHTAFIQNGSLLAAIGLSGPRLSEDANKDFNRLIESLRWL